VNPEKPYKDSRVHAIVGASYGGYAALVGATKTPDRYRCAVSISGNYRRKHRVLNS
jgi:dipeptidyl aminopeptidase/acylaminoacyl peptidase